jgi:hypothetical protein
VRGTRASGDQQDGRPVERFKPTNGAFVGWAGILLAALAIGYVLVAQHSLAGLRLALGAAFAAALVWSTQLRPRVTAYPRHLRLHGPVRDTLVPYVAINEVTLGQTLNVRVGTRRFVCVGIGRSIGFEMRQRVRSQGSSGGAFGNRAYQFASPADTAVVPDAGVSYASFVLDRINDLVAAARSEESRERAVDAARDVRRQLAVPEVVALVVTGVAFAASLLL